MYQQEQFDPPRDVAFPKKAVTGGCDWPLPKSRDPLPKLQTLIGKDMSNALGNVKNLPETPENNKNTYSKQTHDFLQQ